MSQILKNKSIFVYALKQFCKTSVEVWNTQIHI